MSTLIMLEMAQSRTAELARDLEQAHAVRRALAERKANRASRV